MQKNYTTVTIDTVGQKYWTVFLGVDNFAMVNWK